MTCGTNVTKVCGTLDMQMHPQLHWKHVTVYTNTVHITTKISGVLEDKVLAFTINLRIMVDIN